MKDPMARIEGALARLGAEHEPPVGWEARVLAASKPKSRPWWWFAFPVVALAVIAIVLFFRPKADHPLALAYKVEKGGVVKRGDSAQVGDIVHASATGGGPNRVIWVYRDDQLLLACPGAPQCRMDGDATIADIALRAPGEYVIIALTSSSPVPAPAGDLDPDVARAKQAGASESRQPLKVR